MADNSKKRKLSAPQWAKSFHPPSPIEVNDALGSFPITLISEGHHSARKELLETLHKAGSPTPHPADIDNADAYQAVAKNCDPLPEPTDSMDWLASDKEDPQSFNDYCKSLSMRSGRFKPSTGVKHSTICLVPLLSKGTEEWPAYGPSLDELVDYTKRFFQVPVRLLPPASVGVLSSPLSKPGAFAGRLKQPLSWHWNLDGWEQSTKLRGRVVEKKGHGGKRFQILVDSVLDELSMMRKSGLDSSIPCLQDCGLLLGITQMDLYSEPSDLFIAGMAAGGSHVAVFSFHRYHPTMKMSPEIWWDYGYNKRASSDSYYRPSVKVDKLSAVPSSSTGTLQREYLRRSSKLLVHELAHLYQVGHCVYYDCVMRGTGHLVEDFAAPSHLCPIDLRKLQYRLGFDLRKRHTELAEIMEQWGLQQEAKKERLFLKL